MFDRCGSPASLRRLRAVLALRDLSIVEFAETLGISDSHLRLVVLRERKPSPRLLRALVEALGAQAWTFVCGAEDVLRAT
jgi:transcriptional regulator with XRE-family HTH domain